MTKEDKIKHLCTEVLGKGFKHAADHILHHFEFARDSQDPDGFKNGAEALVAVAECRTSESALRDYPQYKEENTRVAGFYRRAAQILRGP